jgi:ribosomal subunit interface protein
VEVVLKGRGYKISDHDRELAEHKLAKLSRIEPRSVRVEVEIISEKNPRLDGTKRVEASLSIPRKTFRAHAESSRMESAFDELTERLERQLRDHHTKGRPNKKQGNGGIKSRGSVPEQAEEED